MGYASLQDCIKDLENQGELIRIKDTIDPYLEMACLHRRVYRANGPALFFENIKGCSFPAVSNIFGTQKRWRFIFRRELRLVEKAISLKADTAKFLKELPSLFLKEPKDLLRLPYAGITSIPTKISPARAPVLENKTLISKLPQITCWPMDGGAFITLPQVFSRDPNNYSMMKSNLGMYRVQLSGNEYVKNKEIGLHYQIHRGIGVHHAIAIEQGRDLPVSIFVGGSPAHSVAAVMPMPEGMSELIIAGMLSGKRFRYSMLGEHVVSSDADFCITGWIRGRKTKPEGPFGDHLGYYSLKHEFPVFEVENVYHRTNAIWPFTVVGRPPQEDTSFGEIIHELTCPMVPVELPGVKDIYAVDVAGVHPLLLAIGSERYVPYSRQNFSKPLEIITQAFSVLGFNQCSLAKYFFIVASSNNKQPACSEVEEYINYVLERVDWTRDLHFQTKISMDTLDYSGDGLNSGSKLIVAVNSSKRRSLDSFLPEDFSLPNGFFEPKFIANGILALAADKFVSYEKTKEEINKLCESLSYKNLEHVPLIVVVDDSFFVSINYNNFLWVTFTRSNPDSDIYGVNSLFTFKHWGCRGSLIIDARIKSHHAPELEEDDAVMKRVDRFFKKNASLAHIKEI
jgi:4-hydroxy-3-polyprenylbenzoate decarboxylase